MKKLFALIGIIFTISLLLIPTVSASYVCPAAYNGGHTYSLTLQSIFPSATLNSALGEAFTANATCYLYNMTFSLAKGGSPGYMRALLMDVTGTVGTDAYPTVQIFQSSTPKDANAFPSSASDQTFYFDGTYQIQSGHAYAAVVIAYNGTWGANYVRVYRAGVNVDNAMNSVKYTDGAWSASTTSETYFIINGDTESELPVATPTPTPTLAPGVTPDDFWSGSIGSTISGAIGLILPLLFMMIPAFFFYKFAGPWGFFAGINVGIILCYLFIPSFPFWAVIVILIVDGLLLFGKVGLHN